MQTAVSLTAVQNDTDHADVTMIEETELETGQDETKIDARVVEKGTRMNDLQLYM